MCKATTVTSDGSKCAWMTVVCYCCLSFRPHPGAALQCAVDAGCSDAVIVASLLHDTGHLVGLRDTALERMGDYGVVKHELHGQAFCDSLGLPPVVGQLVAGAPIGGFTIVSAGWTPDQQSVLLAGHVDAKRYLCWKNRERDHVPVVVPACQ